MMDTYEQNAVSKAIWPWMDNAAPVDGDRARRRRAIIQAGVMVVVAALFGFVVKFFATAVVVCVIATVVLVSGMWVPPVFHGIDRAMKALGIGVGIFLTWVLLVPLFYLVFVPARLGMALRGKDPMQRKFPGKESTYWVPHIPRTAESDYRRQY